MTSESIITLRELKIKSGVVKRTHKEYLAYQKEAEKQNARIESLIAKCAHDADVRKQREVLDETTQILPDTKARLVAAYAALASALESFKEDQSEDVTAAREIYAEATPLIS
ncbi:hypothetical protein BATDEDRAFT_26660 [Batrachochytrium dendrobatidis JAM81]|uniref:Tubulin-specific chaperone A n=2 Tax=Batrachochytrium dendrobatidis TaxID=109871 RepID=F4P834_BATDJ|nr:uncharacterized protein BATDEDRAFT_26660 [Batrachochytrium dendrobatidis JAM81]EGF78544.1 hypothetical protein BATDEDRAFT_26660 [Batrachochytrium dendrobatidis JAM81]KAJ8323918.1 hypothetical protein O5D80_007143 [Batrachochytrium dendrobatidis]KAK5664722.1 hypothetical protein QVD99_008270 [Batrachochytrium dendrobatidis]OAJ43716.1 tubulin binding cofactor A [Batrachochytrium dendrobatidis JEL423]|eukprot:XP_006680727.1 hypothetical protein BATDEDRAFT_26660 [Batrachochytrium dendrobatidis JAM81]